jgi:hypothetical protein
MMKASERAANHALAPIGQEAQPATAGEPSQAAFAVVFHNLGGATALVLATLGKRITLRLG